MQRKSGPSKVTKMAVSLSAIMLLSACASGDGEATASGEATAPAAGAACTVKVGVAGMLTEKTLIFGWYEVVLVANK